MLVIDIQTVRRRLEPSGRNMNPMPSLSAGQLKLKSFSIAPFFSQFLRVLPPTLCVDLAVTATATISPATSKLDDPRSSVARSGSEATKGVGVSGRPAARASTTGASGSGSGGGFVASLFFNMPGARAIDVDDPLALVMAPPPNETPDERALRVQREEDARRISEQIDEQLRREKQEQRRKKIVKLLLLGQSESGAFMSHVLS